MSSKKVQNTHMSDQIRILHGALIDIVSVMNRPQRDEIMVREAGISLDRALFPLLVLIERLGPIGVVDLADRVGRDYTTVSRQVTKLESLDLVKRQDSAADRRSREAAISPKGKVMTKRVDAARNKMGQTIFETWDPDEFDAFVRSLVKFAETLRAEPSADL